MEDLAVRRNDLPAMPTEDVKQYVDVIGDAIEDMKAKLNAAKHLRWESTTIERMTAQINEYSAMRIQAQIELGKRTAEMEKNTEFHGNQFGDAQASDNTKTKTLSGMNLSRQRASEYERMARHEDVVNRYIDHQIERGETPTKAGALQAIYDAMPKPKSPEQDAQETIDRYMEKPVLSIHEVALVKSSQDVLDVTTVKKVWRDLAKTSGCLMDYCHPDFQAGEFETFVRAADDETKRESIDLLNRLCGYAMKLRNQLERSM